MMITIVKREGEKNEGKYDWWENEDMRRISWLHHYSWPSLCFYSWKSTRVRVFLLLPLHHLLKLPGCPPKFIRLTSRLWFSFQQLSGESSLVAKEKTSILDTHTRYIFFFYIRIFIKDNELSKKKSM